MRKIVVNGIAAILNMLKAWMDEAWLHHSHRGLPPTFSLSSNCFPLIPHRRCVCWPDCPFQPPPSLAWHIFTQHTTYFCQLIFMPPIHSSIFPTHTAILLSPRSSSLTFTRIQPHSLMVFMCLNFFRNMKWFEHIAKCCHVVINSTIFSFMSLQFLMHVKADSREGVIIDSLILQFSSQLLST